MIKTQIANPTGAVNGQDERAKARRWQPRPVSQMGNQGATAKNALLNICNNKLSIIHALNINKLQDGIILFPGLLWGKIGLCLTEVLIQIFQFSV